ncbi:hypothetical protein HY491_03210 [Candidatus Woesearchaeota archaeon]|nr:hypothetical protein [Candidatus Woesearchaeota archaeon]
MKFMNCFSCFIIRTPPAWLLDGNSAELPMREPEGRNPTRIQRHGGVRRII